MVPKTRLLGLRYESRTRHAGFLSRASCTPAIAAQYRHECTNDIITILTLRTSWQAAPLQCAQQSRALDCVGIMSNHIDSIDVQHLVDAPAKQRDSLSTASISHLTFLPRLAVAGVAKFFQSGIKPKILPLTQGKLQSLTCPSH